MKTLKKVEIEPVYVHYMPHAIEMEQGKLYISKEFEIAIHLCLCGCGEQTVTPIYKEIAGEKGWELIEHDNGKISLTPSIGNFQFPCKSHYIITKNVANFV